MAEVHSKDHFKRGCNFASEIGNTMTFGSTLSLKRGERTCSPKATWRRKIQVCRLENGDKPENEWQTKIKAERDRSPRSEAA